MKQSTLKNRLSGQPGRHRGLAVFFRIVLIMGALGQPALAVDPLYQPQLQRLMQVIGSLYFLQPLCGFKEQDWRLHGAELIELDQPNDDRRQRLTGAFNHGYQVYARLYLECTGSAQQAMGQLLEEAATLSRTIHARNAE
jgi:uncharacterized protein (TIGR02301 family)